MERAASWNEQSLNEAAAVRHPQVDHRHLLARADTQTAGAAALRRPAGLLAPAFQQISIQQGATRSAAHLAGLSDGNHRVSSVAHRPAAGATHTSPHRRRVLAHRNEFDNESRGTAGAAHELHRGRVADCEH